MHPTRWGDPAARRRPARRRPRAGGAGLRPGRPPARGHAAPVALPAARACPTPRSRDLAAVVGAEHVLTDDETRRLRTRGKSTPDLLRARAGDLADAPDAVVRPGDARRGAGRARRGAVEHRVAVVPFGGGTSVTGGLVARRDGFAGVVSLDLVRMKRLLAVDPVSMTATLEPGLRGPEAEALLGRARADPRPLPAVLRVRHRSAASPRPARAASPSAGYGRFDALVVGLDGRHPAGHARPRHARRPAPPAPTCASSFLGSEGAFGVITSVTVRVRPRARR